MLLLFAAVAIGLQPISEAERTTLLAIRTASEANRVGFLFGELYFDYVVGAASDEKTAQLGIINDSLTYQVHYVFDNSNYLYELYQAPEITASKIKQVGENSFVGPLGSKRFLSSAKFALVDQLNIVTTNGIPKHQHQAYIGAASDNVFGGSPIPDNVGVRGPRGHHVGLDIDRMLDGRDDLHLLDSDFSATLDGRAVAYLKFASPTAVREYWLDVERGALPLKLRVIYNPGTGTETGLTRFYKDIRNIEGKGHLPFKVILFNNGRSVQKMSVNIWEFNKPPARSQFQLRFPKPISLVNTDLMVKYEPRELWDLTSLDGTGAKQPAKLHTAPNSPPPPAMPGPIRGGSPVPALALIGVGAAVIGATLYWRRRNAAT